MDRAVKNRTIVLLVIAEILAMGLWFVSAAILNDLQSTADRWDPRHVFFAAALLGALFNLLVLALPPGSSYAVALRFLTGFTLAGVYPVGMKIMVGWGTHDRGWLVGLLVGGLSLGSSSPHLLAWLGGAAWEYTVVAASGLSAIGGLLVLGTNLGPNHVRAKSFDPTAITDAWRNVGIRRAFGGYFGHMWELYAMWTWLGVASAVSYRTHLAEDEATQLAKLTAFIAIAAGALLCPIAGKVADAIGKAKLTIIVLSISGSCALLSAWVFNGPVVLVFALFVLWGMAVIPDSAQFSALVADLAPPDRAGSILTLQTALGFLLTIATVQLTPLLALWITWPGVFVVLALGPLFGIVCMWPLMNPTKETKSV